MAETQNLHLLYKKLGETPNDRILRFKKDHPEFENEPMTYAGRLDPMAEGLLIVLSGSDLQEKDKYLALEKTYECEILWGFETDTLDMLGLVTKKTDTYPDENQIRHVMQNFTGKFEQDYPAYSSKPVNGKPLFEWAREGKLSEIDIPKHEVSLFNAHFISRSYVSYLDLLEQMLPKIQSVTGDFRQNEIMDKWKFSLAISGEKSYAVDKISLVVSSGFYVRQFVSDVAAALGMNAITFHIKRTKVGEFDVKDAE